MYELSEDKLKALYEELFYLGGHGLVFFFMRSLGHRIGKDTEKNVLDINHYLDKVGKLVYSTWNEMPVKGEITLDESKFAHLYVKLWNYTSKPVCKFTEGYIEGFCFARYGKKVRVKEILCRGKDDLYCTFEVNEIVENKA